MRYGRLQTFSQPQSAWNLCMLKFTVHRLHCFTCPCMSNVQPSVTITPLGFAEQASYNNIKSGSEVKHSQPTLFEVAELSSASGGFRFVGTQFPLSGIIVPSARAHLLCSGTNSSLCGNFAPYKLLCCGDASLVVEDDVLFTWDDMLFWFGKMSRAEVQLHSKGYTVSVPPQEEEFLKLLEVHLPLLDFGTLLISSAFQVPEIIVQQLKLSLGGREGKGGSSRRPQGTVRFSDGERKFSRLLSWMPCFHCLDGAIYKPWYL